MTGPISSLSARAAVVLVGISLFGLALMDANLFLDYDWLCDVGLKIWAVSLFGAITVTLAMLFQGVLSDD